MEILETVAQSLEIERILNDSYDFTLIVSPYFKINPRLKPKLAACFNRNKNNLILYRINEMSQDQREWLNSFPNVKLIPIKNLHAKCYLNENMALITSMNLYDYSQVNNHEIGIKITIPEHQKQFIKLLEFIESILHTDYPDFDFSIIYDLNQHYSIGDIYNKLVVEYDFPSSPKILDGKYIYMCQIATSISDFPLSDYKSDKTALIRSAKLSKTQYDQIRKAIILKGIKRNK